MSAHSYPNPEEEINDMNKAAVRVKSEASSAPVGLWVPKQDQTLLIELPGERLLASVAKVVNPDTVICELINMPLMSKNHHYEKGDFVPCERTVTPFETVWRAFRPQPRTPESAPKPKARRKRN